MHAAIQMHVSVHPMYARRDAVSAQAVDDCCCDLHLDDKSWPWLSVNMHSHDEGQQCLVCPSAVHAGTPEMGCI